MMIFWVLANIDLWRECFSLKYSGSQHDDTGWPVPFVATCPSRTTARVWQLYSIHFSIISITLTLVWFLRYHFECTWIQPQVLQSPGTDHIDRTSHSAWTSQPPPPTWLALVRIPMCVCMNIHLCDWAFSLWNSVQAVAYSTCSCLFSTTEVFSMCATCTWLSQVVRPCLRSLGIQPTNPGSGLRTHITFDLDLH